MKQKAKGLSTPLIYRDIAICVKLQRNLHQIAV